VTATAGLPVSDGDLTLVTMLARGYTTSLTAREMHLSPYTVGERISVLLERFNCKNRAELVAFCYVHGLLSGRTWPPEQRDRAGHATPGARYRTEGGPAEMPFDALEALRQAGQPIDLLSGSQREVLAALTEHEVDVLLSIQRRLSEVEPEVEGQEMKLL
jgi:DNA-binding CsgD family transcriptional regulator